MGTGIAHETHDGVPENPCTSCSGTGKVQVETIDITDLIGKIDMLQTNIDQIAEVVKKNSEYIEKIYEIVSKEK
jgi:hypothetical protein